MKQEHPGREAQESPGFSRGEEVNKPRYAAAFKAATPDEFARRIWQAGYATDPQYPAKLVRLMDQYELRQYDQQEVRMPKVFLSPSDQDNNPVHGGGHEQQYAQVRCRVAADVLRNSGIDVKVSEVGIGDDSNGYVASVKEGEAWGPDLYIADHSNAVGGAVKRRGIHMYTWPGDAEGRKVAQFIIDEVRPVFGGSDYPTAILNGSHLYEVNGPSATAVLMELGFHDHPEDAAIIRTRSVEIGAAVGRAIAKYYGKTTQPSQEDDMSAEGEKRIISLLENQEWKTHTILESVAPQGKEGSYHRGHLTVGQQEIKDALARIESRLSALESPSAVVEVDTSVVAEAARQGAADAINGATITTSSMTGTSISTPTTVARAAPDWKPNREMAAATASSKKLEAPMRAEGQATLCCSPTLRLSQ